MSFEGLISEEELSGALKAMECNKSPGCDGLTTNFYRDFWPILGEGLTRVYNYAFENGFLTYHNKLAAHQSSLLFHYNGAPLTTALGLSPECGFDG